MSSHNEKLLELAMQRATGGKGDLAASIAETCLAPGAGLSGSELSLAFDIVRILIDSVEVGIRRHLAAYLAERDDVPEDLVEFLVNMEPALSTFFSTIDFDGVQEYLDRAERCSGKVDES